MQASESDLWVFRDARSLVSGKVLVRELQKSLEKVLQGPANEQEVLETLIRAGALESALADAAAAGSEKLSAVTDCLSAALFTSDTDSLRRAASALEHLIIPDTIPTSPPEGFSYYAVHPLDFVAAAEDLPLSSSSVAVIGIRNIGATLSALVAATLRARGRNACRMTIRPHGHPYQRVTTFNDQQCSWIGDHLHRGADFVVVDEGPGRSGSTFLSVGEALLSAGVPLHRITFLGTRDVAPAQLCARDGARRWKRFRFRAARQTRLTRFAECTYIGGGEWRNIFLSPKTRWPECWPQMERLKFLSSDGRQMFKFEGMGRIGAAVRQRSLQLAQSGFAPQIQHAEDGFSCYSIVPGRPMPPEKISENTLEHIARYCAFRFSEFPAEGSSCSPLADMLESNLAREFGIELSRDTGLMFNSARPILVDGRMQPHEWIQMTHARLLKTDGASHGDDHFFPGPTDITWDLAGVALEWDFPPDATSFLLARFHNLTGKDPLPCFSAFSLAYAVFRLAWCKMALTTVAARDEEIRLQKSYLKYSAWIQHELQRRGYERLRPLQNCPVKIHSRFASRRRIRQACTAESSPALHD
jgi:hypothetical protein